MHHITEHNQLMKRIHLLCLTAAIILTAACGGNRENTTAQTASNDSTSLSLPGDSTLYGLACDGCSDTIVVMLTNLDGAPDTFDILEASRQHKVFGHPRVGDQIALVINPEDATIADLVINLEQLKGTWCYLVKPTLRERAGITDSMRQEMTTRMPDSIRRRLMRPREYGFQLLANAQARPIGMERGSQSSRQQSPVVWPEIRRYRSWHLFNGRLVLTQRQRDSLRTPPTDTADFVLLRHDTLVLRYNDGSRQGFYRKKK